MIRRLVTALAALLLATASLVGISPAAPASAKVCTPARDYIEGWDGTDTCATFMWSYIYYIVPHGGCKDLPNANTSYVYNNTGNQFFAYTGWGCTGTSAPLYAWNGGPMNSTFNNNLRSIRRQ